MRRSASVVAVLLIVAARTLGGSSAGAQTYPPAPTGGSPSGVSSQAPGSTEVVVQGTPRRGALGRTGASDTVPMVAMATGSLLLGATLVAVARRRRAAPEFWAPSGR
jgi:hypothetical protein